MQIEVNGKTLGIKFSNYAVEYLPKVKNPAGSVYTSLAAMVWAGYLAYCVWKQIDPDPSIEFGEIQDWVDSSVNDEKIADQVGAIYKLYEENPTAQRVKKKELQNGQLQEELPSANLT